MTRRRDRVVRRRPRPDVAHRLRRKQATDRAWCRHMNAKATSPFQNRYALLTDMFRSPRSLLRGNRLARKRAKRAKVVQSPPRHPHTSPFFNDPLEVCFLDPDAVTSLFTVSGNLVVTDFESTPFPVEDNPFSTKWQEAVTKDITAQQTNIIGGLSKKEWP